MRYRVRCPHCSVKVKTPRKYMGRTITCPGCRTKFRAPEAPHAGASTDPDEVAPWLTRRKLIAFTAGLAFVAIVAGGVGAVIRGTVIRGTRTAATAGKNTGKRSNGSGSRDGTNPTRQRGRPAKSKGSGPKTTAKDERPKDEISKDGAGGASSTGDLALAAKVEKILRANCYRCHGEGGADEGGFNFVLSRDRLVADGKVVPGKPGDSSLFDRMSSGKMPPEDESPRPSSADVKLIEQWIAAGAPDFAAPLERQFVTNDNLVRFLRDDLEGIDQRDRRFTRYFTLPHLYNAGISDDELETYRLALAKLVNSLSWSRALVKPRPIDPPRTILAIDLRDVSWDEKIWQAIVDADPYAVVFDTPDTLFCTEATGGSRVPHVRADWFVKAASQPPLYHVVLQLPNTQAELEKLLKVDVAGDIAQERVVRAGFTKSGVSSNNRLLERHDSAYGAFWLSYDFKRSKGRKDLQAHPLGPGADPDFFQHDGGEIIFNLPNDLQGYMLVDATGKRIDKGPQEIVTDPNRPDDAVTNGISCMSCHYEGIKTRNDQIRAHVEANRLSFGRRADDILALYKGNDELNKWYAEDAERFTNALQMLGITRITQTAEPVVNMALQFESDLTLAAALAELGLRPQEFRDGVIRFPELARSLGALIPAGGTITRDVFIDTFAAAVEAFQVGTRVKPKPQKGPRDPNLRTWTDLSGKHQLEAEFLSLVKGRVALKKANGRLASVPLRRLSAKDRRFVLSQPSVIPPDGLPPAEGGAGLPPAPPGEGIGELAIGEPAIDGPIVGTGRMRTWIDLRKNKQFVAVFEKLYQGRVRLETPRGIHRDLPVMGVSPADREYIKEQLGAAEYESESEMPLLWAGRDEQSSPAPRNYYTAWSYEPRRDYYYSTYSFRPHPIDEAYLYHTVIYWPSRPRYVYYYNSRTTRYWGRYDLQLQGYSQLASSDRKGTLAEIPDSAFPTPGEMPPIPESSDGARVPPPPPPPIE